MELTRRKLLELIENDYPFASYDRLDAESREIIDSLVEDGLLEMTEQVMPPGLYEAMQEMGGPLIIHDYRVTAHGLMYMQGAVNDGMSAN